MLARLVQSSAAMKLPAAPDTSLNRNAGGVFFKLLVGIEVVANRRAWSTLTLDALFISAAVV
jgi:hypothetical protein